MSDLKMQYRVGVELNATLFGELRLATSTGVPITLNNRRAGLILAIVCLQPERSIDRSALAKLLWPDRFEAQAKASLRQCLLDLRRALEEHGVNGLTATRSAVSLAPDSVLCDRSVIEAALESDPAQAVEALITIGNRPLLQGASLNPEFDAWLAAQREHCDTRLKAAISKALSVADEATERALVEAARARFPTLRSATPAPSRLTLALLPFSQVDEQEGNLYLADAVVDELSSRLSRTEGLAIVGRTSVAAVTQKPATLPEMAQELGATHLIEGDVRRRAEAIEVRMALIDGNSGTQLWSHTMTGSIEDFLQSRTAIGANVIAAMCSALGLKPASAPTRPMTGNREAYALYLQGHSIAQRLTANVLPKGIDLLEQALEIDPRFAECWTALADAHIMTAATTPTLERAEHTEKGAQCARKALDLDPGQAHAYSVLGVTEWCRFNPARALDLAYEAYARDPNDADVASRLGSTLLYLGKSQEGLPFAQAAVDLDPINGRNYVMLASAYLNVGDYEKALNAGQSAVDLGGPRLWLAISQFVMGDYEAAVTSHYANRFFLGTTIMRPPGMPPMDDAARDAYFDLAARGLFNGKLEDRAAYSQLVAGLHATMPDPHDTSIVLPAIWMGQAELVMKIYSERIHPANIYGLMNLWIDADPYSQTRKHPDFMAFADKIGMTEAWNRYGWPDLLPSDPRTSQSAAN